MRKEGLVVFHAASPLSNLVVLFFLCGLPYQSRDFLRLHCPVVDTDIVDQAGEVGSVFHAFTATDV